MADNPEFYRARAEDERKSGDAATLDNVRDRHRRAEAAWVAMAVRTERTQILRATREAATAASVEAGKLAALEAAEQH